MNMHGDDAALFHDIVERDLFIELVADGVPAQLAGFQVGWTPRQTKRNLQDADFAEMVCIAEELCLDSVEYAMVKLAKKGNLGAQQMVLYNRRPDRWKDLRRIEVKTETNVTIHEIQATRMAAVELLRSHGVAALQPGGALDIIDVESDE